VGIGDEKQSAGRLTLLCAYLAHPNYATYLLLHTRHKPDFLEKSGLFFYRSKPIELHPLRGWLRILALEPLSTLAGADPDFHEHNWVKDTVSNEIHEGLYQ
jgi:hypothetical protein